MLDVSCSNIIEFVAIFVCCLACRLNLYTGLFLFDMEEPSLLDGSSMSSDNCLSNKQKYDSVAGRALCKRILKKYLLYEPHNYILDGICPVMDGYDLLATTPTVSGKSGYYILLMLIVHKIAADESGRRGFQRTLL